LIPFLFVIHTARHVVEATGKFVYNLKRRALFDAHTTNTHLTGKEEVIGSCFDAFIPQPHWGADMEDFFDHFIEQHGMQINDASAFAADCNSGESGSVGTKRKTLERATQDDYENPSRNGPFLSFADVWVRAVAPPATRETDDTPPVLTTGEFTAILLDHGFDPCHIEPLFETLHGPVDEALIRELCCTPEISLGGTYGDLLKEGITLRSVTAATAAPPPPLGMSSGDDANKSLSVAGEVTGGSGGMLVLMGLRDVPTFLGAKCPNLFIQDCATCVPETVAVALPLLSLPTAKPSSSATVQPTKGVGVSKMTKKRTPGPGNARCKSNRVAAASGGANFGVPKSPAERNNSNRSFLILACDGLWDVMSNEEACRFVRNKLNAWETESVHSRTTAIADALSVCCAKELCLAAIHDKDRYTGDNVTAMVVLI
jgi:hypothetical protein